mmetsp:Transcript_4347/g.10892  ORF Transcript_4347/g.10892 Transcript_4347/m.10892 type:complete len:339 (-) Transcript_4347:357-1373(-)
MTIHTASSGGPQTEQTLAARVSVHSLCDAPAAPRTWQPKSTTKSSSLRGLTRPLGEDYNSTSDSDDSAAASPRPFAIKDDTSPSNSFSNLHIGGEQPPGEKWSSAWNSLSMLVHDTSSLMDFPPAKRVHDKSSCGAEPDLKATVRCDSPKRRKINRVSWGSSVVRLVPGISAHDEDTSKDETSSDSGDEVLFLGECEEEETRATDGPSTEAMHVNKMVVDLFKSRDPNTVTGTLRDFVENHDTGLLNSVHVRVTSLVSRIKATGKASLLPSCVVLKGEGLPVLEWVQDCTQRAIDFIAKEDAKKAEEEEGAKASRRGSLKCKTNTKGKSSVGPKMVAA